MSIPDCELNSFNYEPVFPVAQKCLSQIVEEVAEQITKSASVFRPTAKCIIPAAKVPLIARMFIITHLKYKHSSNRDGSTEDRPRPRKRAKKSSSQLFDILLHSTALAHFQILLEILRTWKHRIDQETAQFNVSSISEDEQKFCSRG
uniref:Uncharacterized protein n=1 Tax=Ditylenchus dipsaci TaxID=166011 RepID=A0A915CWK8_9BILA